MQIVVKVKSINDSTNSRHSNGVIVSLSYVYTAYTVLLRSLDLAAFGKQASVVWHGTARGENLFQWRMSHSFFQELRRKFMPSTMLCIWLVFPVV